MSNLRATAIIIGALATIPARGFALPSADTSQPKPAALSAATSKPTTHATKGVVKSMDTSTLVIRRSPSGPDMRFTLNPATEREGNVKVGSTVEVRYRTEAHQRVATVVATAHPKTSSGVHPAAQ
jgi:hypothetical protein